MTGETYLTDYIRITSREQALRALARVKEREAQQDKLVKKGKLKKIITFNKEQRLTKYRYVPVNK